MKKLNSKFLIVAIILLLGSMFAIPVFGAGSSNDQVLNVAVNASDLKTLDPHMAVTTQDRGAVDMIYNGLVRFKPGTMDPEKIQPDLAKDWKASKDRLEWTFYLRKGVRVQPYPGNPTGYELTSEDVVFSIKRAANPDRSAYAGMYDNLKSAKAVDKYTVKLTFNKRVPSVLGLVADYSGGFIVPKKAVKALGEKFATHPVGTGPFKFKSYTSGGQLVLTGWDKYFRGEPKLEKVVWRYMPDVSSRLAGLRTGKLDLIEGLRKQSWIKKVAKYKGIEPVVFGPGETVTMHFNLTRSSLDKLKVRKAIAYALSRKTIRNFYGKQIMSPLYAPVPPNYLGGLDKAQVSEAGLLYKQNMEKAKQLLKEAGYPDGFKLDVVITHRGSYRKTLIVAQQELKKVGIKLNIKTIGHSAYHSQIRDDVDPIVIYVCARFPTANTLLTQFYHSSSIVTKPTAITNFSHYGDVDADGDGTIDNIDNLIEIARTAKDPKLQKMLWAKAQKEILSDLAAYPIGVLGFSFAKDKKLKWGYDLKSTLALTPQIKWTTKLAKE